jgi:hypothetical protein
VIIPPRYQEVRPFLLTNPAYKILLQRARSAATLADRRQAAIESIAHVISAAFMSLRANSDATYRTREVRVSLNQDLPSILRSQNYDSVSTSIMEHAITITGGSDIAQDLPVVIIWNKYGGRQVVILLRLYRMQSFRKSHAHLPTSIGLLQLRWRMVLRYDLSSRALDFWWCHAEAKLPSKSSVSN